MIGKLFVFKQAVIRQCIQKYNQVRFVIGRKIHALRLTIGLQVPVKFGVILDSCTIKVKDFVQTGKAAIVHKSSGSSGRFRYSESNWVSSFE